MTLRLWRMAVGAGQNSRRPYAVYELDETSGSTAFDSSGNGLDADAFAIMDQTGLAGDGGRSYLFDSEIQHRIDMPFTFDFSQPWTITWYANVVTPGGSGAQFFNNEDETTGDGGSAIFMNSSGEIVFRTNSNPKASTIFDSGTDYRNATHAFGMRFDGVNIAFFADGAFVEDTAFTPESDAGHNLRVGRFAEATGVPFDGRMDKIKLYRVALGNAAIINDIT